MTSRKTFGLAGLTALLIGCGAAVQWKDSCGCLAIGASLMQELHWSELPGNPSLAPIPVAQQIESLLAKSDKNQGTLQNLRAMGPWSNQVCFAAIGDSYRCTYWLWENGRKRKGIQVDVIGSKAVGHFVEGSIAAQGGS